MHIVISSRRLENPECISAHTDRAHARAAGSPGHIPGCRSARYSAIASESQTIVAPSCRQGTRPVGEKLRFAGFGWDSPDSATITSSKGAPESFAASQPRSDHDE
jgi:hypothetical protein